jgi:hypothetical protein
VVEGKWFENNLSLCVGNGVGVSFWEDKWVGNEPLKAKYKRLFDNSLQKDCAVAEMGAWGVGGWSWELMWRRGWFEWENELINNFMQDLTRVSLSCFGQDAWRWIPDVDGYSVRSAYKAQLSLEVVAPCEIFQKIWAGWIPAKVQAFGWRLVLGRIPTLDNLLKRGVVIGGGGNLCYFCNNHNESVKHLFFECTFSYAVWQGCLDWLGVVAALPNSCVSHLLLFESWGGRKPKRGVLCSIWFSCVWNLWIHRNHIAFQGALPSLSKVLYGVKAHSWFWSKNLGKGVDASFLDWSREINRCF